MILVVCTAGADRSVALAKQLRELLPNFEFKPCGISRYHTRKRKTMHVSEWLPVYPKLILCVETVHQAYVGGYFDALNPTWRPEVWNVRNMTPERIAKKIREAV
jgi:hypothetical protein